MGHIVAARKFYDNPDLMAILVKASKPDRMDNWYYVEIVRIWGNDLIWVRIWHSAHEWANAFEAFQNCTI